MKQRGALAGRAPSWSIPRGSSCPPETPDSPSPPEEHGWGVSGPHTGPQSSPSATPRGPWAGFGVGEESQRRRKIWGVVPRVVPVGSEPPSPPRGAALGSGGALGGLGWRWHPDLEMCMKAGGERSPSQHLHPVINPHKSWGCQTLFGSFSHPDLLGSQDSRQEGVEKAVYPQPRSPHTHFTSQNPNFHHILCLCGRPEAAIMGSSRPWRAFSLEGDSSRVLRV